MQRKTRSALTVVGVGLAVMLYVYYSVIVSWYNKDFERQLPRRQGRRIVEK